MIFKKLDKNQEHTEARDLLRKCVLDLDNVIEMVKHCTIPPSDDSIKKNGNGKGQHA